MSIANAIPAHGKIKPLAFGVESMSLGTRIKHARTRLGMSQTDLARAVGTAQPVISQLEHGRQQTSGILVQLATALKVRPQWLASGAGPMEVARSPRSEKIEELSAAAERMDEGKLDALIALAQKMVEHNT